MKVFLNDEGQNVAELQDLLRRNGFDPGPTDGIFGPMTLKALNAFQASMGYPISPSTNAETFDALRRNTKSSEKAIRVRKEQHVPVVLPQTDPVTLKVLEFAKSFLGVEEEPLGSNSGPTVDKFTKRWRVPWCAAFVSYVINETPWYKDGLKLETVKPYIYAVVKWKALLESTGRYVNREYFQSGNGRAPQPGDLFIILYEGADGVDTGHGHVGFVVSYDAETKQITTLEGNTSNGVRSKKRSITDLSGWGRPAPMPA